MSLTLFIVVMVSAFVVAAVGAYFVNFAHKKNEQKRDFRRYLIERMQQVPLPRMLLALGIGARGFAYRESVDKIDESIKHCENCNTIDQCHEKLKIPELNPEDINFCNNQKFLSQFSRSKRIKGS
jgi:ABC-type multidrug transport system fused ATPase/permease subunit